MAHNRMMEYVLSLIVRWLNVQKGDAVLDIGCGDCFFCEKIATFVPNARVIGCDTLIRHKDLGKKVDLVISDAQHLPFKNDSISKIIVNEVLEHLPDSRLAISEIARVLAMRGRAYIATPNSYSEMLKLFMPLALRGDKYDGHLRHFSLRELERMFRNNGLAIIHHHYEGFFGAFLYSSFIYYVLKPAAQRSNPTKRHRVLESRFGHSLSFRLLTSLGNVFLLCARRFDNIFNSWNKGMGIHLVVTRTEKPARLNASDRNSTNSIMKIRM